MPVLPHVRKYHFDMKSVDLTPENIKSYDVVLISTNHACYDYGEIVRHARLVVDTRNAAGNVKDKEKIVKA